MEKNTIKSQHDNLVNDSQDLSKLFYHLSKPSVIKEIFEILSNKKPANNASQVSAKSAKPSDDCSFQTIIQEVTSCLKAKTPEVIKSENIELIKAVLIQLANNHKFVLEAMEARRNKMIYSVLYYLMLIIVCSVVSHDSKISFTEKDLERIAIAIEHQITTDIYTWLRNEECPRLSVSRQAKNIYHHIESIVRERNS